MAVISHVSFQRREISSTHVGSLVRAILCFVASQQEFPLVRSAARSLTLPSPILFIILFFWIYIQMFSALLFYAGETQIWREFRCQKALSYDFRNKHTSGSNCVFLDGVVNVTGASLQIIPKNHTCAMQTTQNTHAQTDSQVAASDLDSMIHVRFNATTPTHLLNELGNIRYTFEMASKVTQDKITYNGFTENSGYSLLDSQSHSLTNILKEQEARYQDTHRATSVFSNEPCGEKGESHAKQPSASENHLWDLDIQRSLFRTDIKGRWEARVIFYQMKSSIDTDILKLLEIDPNTAKLKNERVLLGRIVIPFDIL